jgi:hypothetical protein
VGAATVSVRACAGDFRGCAHNVALGRALGSAPGGEQLKISVRSPWQNGYAERFVGTLRRELLDHLIVLGERHLLRAVREYVTYYNDDRQHMALRGDAPVTRPVEPPTRGRSSPSPGSEDFTTATRGPRDRRTPFSPRQAPPM